MMWQKLQHSIQASPVTGLAVGLIENGEVDAIYTLGHLNHQPVQADTLWQVASLTKPLFVYGALELIREGTLDLDRPLQEYLSTPYVANNPMFDRITARHTMMHTSGLPNWRGETGLDVQFEPGTRFSYSSEGLTYLQHVVENITGLSLREYLKLRLFRPLKMESSELAVEMQHELSPRLHFLAGSLLANGALSLRTTIEDYTRFMLTVCNGNHDEMLRPRIAVGDIRNLYWGLGWGLQDTAKGLTCWHWGARGIPSTMSFVLALPTERRAIVVFTNHANGLYLCRDIIAEWLGESFLPAFHWLLPAQLWRPDGKADDTQANVAIG